jgi:hypothetical protein
VDGDPILKSRVDEHTNSSPIHSSWFLGHSMDLQICFRDSQLVKLGQGISRFRARFARSIVVEVCNGVV